MSSGSNHLYRGPAPCEVFSCPSRERCRVEPIACVAFERYVSAGKLIPPDAAALINGQIMLAPEPLPCHALYRRAMASGVAS